MEPQPPATEITPKMSALMDLVSQNQPLFQTHQALLVIGLQNDFVLPDGRLPVNVKKGFLERIQALIPKFRTLNGNVIWVQTLYEADRIATGADTGEGDALVLGGLIDGYESSTETGDEELAKDAKELKDMPVGQSKMSRHSSKHKIRALELLKRVSARRKMIPQEVARATAEQDDELFLLKSEKRMPACVPDTFGAQFADVIARQFELPADMVIKTSHYSAFQDTNLLMTLRAKLVTEVYICGCITNVSVLATVIDAARHGVKINVIGDCLGFRKQFRHDLALKRMEDFFDARVVNSAEILAREPPATLPTTESTSLNGSRKGSSRDNDKAVEALLDKMSLNDDRHPSSQRSIPRSSAKVLTGKQRTLSLVSFVESQKAAQNSSPAPTTGSIAEKEACDERSTAKLAHGAKVLSSPPESDAQEGYEEEKKQGLVKSRIRMRPRSGRKKKAKAKDEESKDKADSGDAVGRHGAVEPVTFSQVPAKMRSIARVGSVTSLRDKEDSQQRLKSVASVPVLKPKCSGNNEDKEKNRLSDLTGRLRLSLSRASRSDDSRKGLNILGSSRTPQSPIKSENRHSKGLSQAASVQSLPSTLAVDCTSVKVSTSPQLRNESGLSLELSSKHPDSLASMSPPLSQINDQTSVTSKSMEPQAPLCQPQPSTPSPSDAPAAKSLQASSAAPSAQELPVERSAKTKSPKLQSLATLPVLGPGDKIATGDSHIVHDFFPANYCHPTYPSKPLKDLIFMQLYNEMPWQTMRHQTGETPRLVCCQGVFGEDGSMPVYRHPTDQALPLLRLSPKVQVIRRRAEKLVGHSLNHVLIQLYRSSNDYISEHSDKTLDVVRGSSIVNVSFGAQRTMRLRTKKIAELSASEHTTRESSQRETQRVPMPHNSMLVLGLGSNEKWLHGIMADKRPAAERHESEKAYNGMRISLTFRNIGTFLDARETTIWGQGATAKHQRDAADVINGDENENERLIRAFSRENHSSEFDWEEYYGDGFDVLHIHEPPKDIPILFAETDVIETQQVQMCLAEAKIAYTLASAPIQEPHHEGKREVTFRDNDTYHSEISASDAILIYLDKWYPFDRSDAGRSCTAAAHVIMRWAARLLACWNQYSHQREDATMHEEVQNNVAVLEDVLLNEDWTFIAGSKFSVADCFVWPIINALVETWDGWTKESFPLLKAYHERTWRKKACAKKLRDKLDKGRKVEEKGK